MKDQHEKDKPGDGVLIFDEVHVVARLLWNSRNQRIVGFSMSHKDMANLLDVYHTLDPGAEYDLCSPISLERPNIFVRCCRAVLYQQQNHGKLLETVKLFHLYGFSTSVLVCDGASSNLTAIKTMMGESGVFDSTAVITPSFPNRCMHVWANPHSIHIGNECGH